MEGEDPDLQTVIRQRFPNQTGSLSEAEIAFVSHTTAAANLSELKDFYKRGGLIVMMRPDGNKFDLLGDDYLSADDDEDFSDNNQLNELFFAYNINEKHYTMYEAPLFDGVYDDEEPQMTDEEWQAIEEANKQYPEDSENTETECLYDNDYDQNENELIIGNALEKPERILAVNTLQVKNYDRYDMQGFNLEAKQRWHEEHWQRKLQNAFDAGKRMAEHII